MNEIPRIKPEVRKELARDARTLLDDPAVKAAIALMRAQWYSELLDPKLDMSGVYELRAKLQVLDAFPKLLEKFVNDERIHGRGN
jgi:hypothetical protein